MATTQTRPTGLSILFQFCDDIIRNASGIWWHLKWKELRMSGRTKSGTITNEMTTTWPLNQETSDIFCVTLYVSPRDETSQDSHPGYLETYVLGFIGILSDSKARGRMRPGNKILIGEGTKTSYGWYKLLSQHKKDICLAFYYVRKFWFNSIYFQMDLKNALTSTIS